MWVDHGDAPLDRLIEARIVSDAGSEIKRVFLLVQKDEYHLQRDALFPLDNILIEDCWQRAFSIYSAQTEDGFFIELANQDKNGRLAPFQSLFYCTARGLFFHPPCPRCGIPLQLCREDELLSHQGLEPYSSSIERYLYCPSCHSSETVFYGYSLECADLPTRRDRLRLIREFGRLKIDVAGFPCHGCPLHRECYGSEDLAASRISPFAFYPFFMLIFDAGTLNALDFIALVSGASLEDLKICDWNKTRSFETRSAVPAETAFFLFDKEDRFFLEVLYLKLSFLTDLARMTLKGMGSLTNPGHGLSLDRVWVKVSEQSHLLPLLWNFKLSIMDIGGTELKGPLLPRHPPFYALYFLGTVWFFTLLVNRKQGIVKVRNAIDEEMMHELPGTRTTPDYPWEKKEDGIFASKNIFWRPEGRSVPPGWRKFWAESLHMGWSLWETGLHGNSNWSKTEFLEGLEKFRGKVKEALFREGGQTIAAEGIQEDEEILSILTNIIEKWKNTERDEPVLPPSGEVEEVPLAGTAHEGWDLHETVLLSPDLSRNLRTSVPAPMGSDLEETVISSPGKRGTPHPVDEHPDLQETRVLPSANHSGGAQPAAGEPDLLETVMIAPKSGKPANRLLSQEGHGFQDLRKGAEPIRDANRRGMEPEEDFLAETIIIGSEKKGERR